MTDWQNWSGNQRHQVSQFLKPDSEQAIAELVKDAASSKKVVRTIGSAHSFTPFWTDDVLVTLDNLKGVVSIDPEAKTARIKAGTKLHELGEPLWNAGFSMVNMGDIDRQSIAGATGTGTHGTGETLGNLSSQIQAMTLVTADGSRLEITPADGDLFKAGQVSLGALGIVTEIVLGVTDAYFLHEKNWACSVSECEARLESDIANNRHFEFFWVPSSDQCLMKTLNPTEDRVARTISDDECVGPNYQILPSARDHKFNESEFSVPREMGWDCFLAVRELMQTRFPEVKWPIEYRTLKADDILLSTAFERETVTISIHQGAKHPYEPFFSEAEKIFREFQGRPHWGKLHSHRFDELQEKLPGLERFCAVRETLDPEGRFLNSHLREVFGIA